MSKEKKGTICIEITEEDIKCLKESCCEECRETLVKLGIIKE
ncbi:MAG: hypothetical protein ACTSP4_15295 [Candidatus Hodarchaeales archaeon]